MSERPTHAAVVATEGSEADRALLRDCAVEPDNVLAWDLVTA